LPPHRPRLMLLRRLKEAYETEIYKIQNDGEALSQTRINPDAF